jgi:ABC-type multidrug transport system fused ATPase/permease subunit
MRQPLNSRPRRLMTSSSRHKGKIQYSSENAIADLAANTSIGDGISFDGVTVAYKGAVVLESLSLDVLRGEIMALIGPSGSGKTTALRAVARFVRPRQRSGSDRQHGRHRYAAQCPRHRHGRPKLHAI